MSRSLGLGLAIRPAALQSSCGEKEAESHIDLKSPLLKESIAGLWCKRASHFFKRRDSGQLLSSSLESLRPLVRFLTPETES